MEYKSSSACWTDGQSENSCADGDPPDLHAVADGPRCGVAVAPGPRRAGPAHCATPRGHAGTPTRRPTPRPTPRTPAAPASLASAALRLFHVSRRLPGIVGPYWA